MEELIKKIDLMKHAIGFENRRITRSRYFNSYRNYFCVSKEDAVWEELVIEGLASKRTNNNNIYYHVSEKGINILERLFNFKYKEID